VIDRRTLLAGTSAVLLATPLAAEAQTAAKIPRIGYLVNSLAAESYQHEAFLQGLHDLGYIEGRNVVIEYRNAEGKFERLPALAAELVGLKVDVIVSAGGTLAALAAKQATKPIPIVFASAGDPVTSGLVGGQSGHVLWQPGGHDERTETDILKGADVAARALGVRLQFVEACGPVDVDRAFSDLTGAHTGALTVSVKS
jgi:ABC transporter substrate binding protein